MKISLSRIIIFRILTVIYIVAVAYLCFANFNRVSEFQKFFLGLPTDKIVHFCMFAPFPVMAFFSYDKATDTVLKAVAAVIVILSVGIIFAGLTEVIQGSLPYRTQDMGDFKADCLGMILSATAVLAYDIYKIKKDIQ